MTPEQILADVSARYPVAPDVTVTIIPAGVQAIDPTHTPGYREITDKQWRIRRRSWRFARADRRAK